MAQESEGTLLCHGLDCPTKVRHQNCYATLLSHPARSPYGALTLRLRWVGFSGAGGGESAEGSRVEGSRGGGGGGGAGEARDPTQGQPLCPAAEVMLVDGEGFLLPESQPQRTPNAPGLLAIYAQEPNSPKPQPTALIHTA
jgi:hypothetical protein